jgi:hypothetical protein
MWPVQDTRIWAISIGGDQLSAWTVPLDTDGQFLWFNLMDLVISFRANGLALTDLFAEGVGN